MALGTSHRSLIAGLAGLTTALAGLAVLATPAQAAAADHLVISEAYGGGGNGGATFTHDFVELYNPTASAVSVAGWSVQYRSKTGTTVNTTALTGSVPAGGHYLVQEASNAAVGAPLPAPDATGNAAMSGSDGVVILVSNADPVSYVGDFAANPQAGVVDMVGYGNEPTSFETANTGVDLTSTTSASRTPVTDDTNHNADDFAEGTPTPTSSQPPSDELAATDPGDKDATVGVAITPFDLEATGGTPDYTWAVTGLPDGITATPQGEVSGAPTEDGTFSATATVTDAEEDTASVDFTVVVSDPGTPVTIADIQGSGAASPVAGQTVATQGVVTAVYPGAGGDLPTSGNLNGFYMQTPGADTTPGASDGIFVFGPSFDESTLEAGDSVQVTGEVSEFGTLTELTADAVTAVADLGDVVLNTVIPGTDCALPGDACPSLIELDAQKEEFEGEAFQPTGDYTVTDAYDGSAANPPNSGSSSFFGEIGLAANSDQPLITPTEVIDAQATDEIAARVKYNNAHRVVLDDGSSTTYWKTDGTGDDDLPFPWFTPDHTVRVGAGVTFDEPVILDYRFGWKVQPASRVIGKPSGLVTFEQDRPAHPEDVGGDLQLATFNVLNYFTTLGVDVPGCTSFNDRDGNPIAVNQCPGDGPRGAWNQASFLRQQAKIVNAINTIDADIVSVEEIENSLKVDGHDRDEAMSALVDALNAEAGAGTWDYVRSPASASDPDNIDEQDVIRTGFIYQPATVDLVGSADMLFDDDAFENAREPFAQVFKAQGADDADGFAVIVNHFKSKGSGVDDGTGQGNSNPDRIAQAEALSTYADGFAEARGIDAVFLTGDFNASSMEDPVQVLTGDGYVSQEEPGEYSYSFDGQSQSLDHVFANPTADDMVAGFDIWQSNANETVYNQYSRYNYDATILYDESPFSASDHNPEVVGIDVADDTRAEATVTASHTPKKVKVGKTEAKLRVVVSALGRTPTGTIRVTVPGHAPETAVLDRHGRATVRLPAFDTLGDHVVEIAYEGDEFVQDTSFEYTVQVVR